MLASLENETVFKKAFTDNTVFTRFVKDILGIDIRVEKIETEKKFEFKPGPIDIVYDIYAESADQRVIIEIQRVDYDYNFDRFLHYHMMAIGELQRSYKQYKVDKTVYTVMVLTAPYKIDQKTGEPILSEVMISSADPRDLEDKVIHLYGHRLVFLNPHYRKDNTPGNYRDWLELIYESIHHPRDYKLNLENEGIKKVVEIIDVDRLGPELLDEMKKKEQQKVMRAIDENLALKKGKQIGLEEGKQIGLEQGKQIGLEEGISEGEKQVALELLKKGIAPDIIAAAAGLSREEIEKLK